MATASVRRSKEEADGPREFGSYLRKLRRGRKLTLEEISSVAHMSYANLAKIERGELPPPSDERLIDFALAYGVHPDEMFWMAKRISPELQHRMFVYSDQYRKMFDLTNPLSRDELNAFLNKATLLVKKLKK